MDSSYKAAKLLDFDSTSNASSEMTGNEEYQVYGPTTRHKWSQWISRPPRVQSASSVSDTENVSEANEEMLSVVKVVNSLLFPFYAPLQRRGLYCFANVGRSVDHIVHADYFENHLSQS